MPEPSITVIGNKASEMGALDQGADFEAINRSELPPMPEPITVRVERGEHEVTLIPEKPFEGEPELLEGSTAIINAQLFDDPQMSPPNKQELMAQFKVAITSMSRLMEITKRSPREALCWFRLDGMKQDISVTADRIIVKQDTLESVYSCRSCKGQAHLEEDCETCHGEGKTCIDCMIVPWGRGNSLLVRVQKVPRMRSPQGWHLVQQWVAARHRYPRYGDVGSDYRNRDFGRP